MVSSGSADDAREDDEETDEKLCERILMVMMRSSLVLTFEKLSELWAVVSGRYNSVGRHSR